MREVLDRLREAESALDKELMETYYQREMPERQQALDTLWEAKQSLWYAQMCVLDTAANTEPVDPT